MQMCNVHPKFWYDSSSKFEFQINFEILNENQTGIGH